VTFNKADVWNFREQVFAATFDYPHDQLMYCLFHAVVFFSASSS